MNAEMVFVAIKQYFIAEISNKKIFHEDYIELYFSNGEKVKIYVKENI